MTKRSTWWEKSHTPDSNSTGGWILCAIFVIALVLRLLHLWTISETGWIDRHLFATNSDDYAFFQWAQTIIAGDWLGRDTYHPYFHWMRDIADLDEWYSWWGGKEIFHQAPLYPYFLAVSLTILKGSVPLVLAMQMLIGSLQVLIIYGIATRLFDQRVGLVAAAITALYGPFVFYQGTLLRDWLVPVLDPLAVLALLHAKVRGGAMRWMLAGAALGLALLCKATALLLILVALAWIVYDRWRMWRETGKSLALVLAGISLSIAPLLVRNVTVGAPVFALSTRMVEAFVLANVRGDPVEAKPILQRSQGSLVSAIRQTAAIHRQTATSLLSQLLGKVRRFVNALETHNNTSFYYGLDNWPVLPWMLRYSFLFPLGVAGLLISLRAWRHHLLLLLYGLSTFATLLATSSISRYRLAAVPVLIVFGAAVAIHGFDAVRHGRTARAFGFVVLVVTMAVIQQASVYRQPVPLYPTDYYAAAIAYKERGELAEAVAELTRLRDRAASNSPISVIHTTAAMEGDFRLTWAQQLLREGRAKLANEQVTLAAVAYGRHPNLPVGSLNLGIVYADLGESLKARTSLQHFIQVAPEHPQAEFARRLLSKLEGASRQESP